MSSFTLRPRQYPALHAALVAAAAGGESTSDVLRRGMDALGMRVVHPVRDNRKCGRPRVRTTLGIQAKGQNGETLGAEAARLGIPIAELIRRALRAALDLPDERRYQPHTDGGPSAPHPIGLGRCCVSTGVCALRDAEAPRRREEGRAA